MSPSLWRKHILPFALMVTALGAATLLGDYVLHRLNLVWVGRYLGIPGTLLIIVSLAYSLRKRKLIATGDIKSWLGMHEVGTWVGSVMVLVHAGIHFNAVLPWLATMAMGVNVISGMVGKVLLGRSREHVQAQREHHQLRGLSASAVEQAVFWEAVTLGAMTQWRRIHIPIFITFAVLALGHIVSVLLFWSWP